MATLNSLKKALRQKATEAESSLLPLSDRQYTDGIHILRRGLGWETYQDFIIPQLSQLFNSLFASRKYISVLEIGPGPRSILENLPENDTWKIMRYDALEPNSLFATKLEERVALSDNMASPLLPYLETQPRIHRVSLAPDGHITSVGIDNDDRYDVILFCSTMYDLDTAHEFIEHALKKLDDRMEDAMVVVFHHGEDLNLGDLVCHRTASFPTGVVSVENNDEEIDSFSAFIAGYTADDVVQVKWREECRALASYDKTHEGHLLFSSPKVMAAFTRRATTLRELTALVPAMTDEMIIKSPEARHRRPASIIRPTEIQHLQHCVRWAREHKFGLTVVSGTHSGHCVVDGVVAVNMEAFNQVYILDATKDESVPSDFSSLVTVEVGSKTGDVVRKTMEAGVAVPLGDRPSVGAGMWLQGGIGHLTRLYGLACDAIIGAVVVSVDTGKVLYVGYVPSQHKPADAVRPENEDDLLWAIRGAGTNFGIVISVTFKAHAAPTYQVRNWIFPLSDNQEMQGRISEVDRLVARQLPLNCSADMYLYWDFDRLHLGVTIFESSTTGFALETANLVRNVLGFEHDSSVVDGVGLFETGMYMSGMHGGHSGGKTSSFKRCVFLQNIGSEKFTHLLVEAIEARPSLLCYLHLLQGGGAARVVATDATAFGCRDWDFACVVNGVWPRNQDGTEAARSVVRWVYEVVESLVPLSQGVYGADLGPDSRDTALAANAFGPNRLRLARLKRKLDPSHMLGYTCPFGKAPKDPKIIILVTGEIGAGKDYCANEWALVFIDAGLKARTFSISDVTKREYAAASGADLDRLLLDRKYKEQHREALTKFFESQVAKRPRLREEHFLNILNNAEEVDALLITGMREEAPVAALWHLVPGIRLLEVRVEAKKRERRRRGWPGDDNDDNDDYSRTTLNHRPDLIFSNDIPGHAGILSFAKYHFFNFFSDDLEQLAGMVRSIPNFPRQGITFRHVLNISQEYNGLSLCASLLENHFAGSWGSVRAIVSCEAGGFLFASALVACRGYTPLKLIREAGKLPPPTISVNKLASHISSSGTIDSCEKRIEMEKGAIQKGVSVVVVDDVLATGKTVCAMLQLLNKAGINNEDITVMVVAEFPVHRGRALLREHGFGKVAIQSLLVYDGE